jgi:hypothetical protein
VSNNPSFKREGEAVCFSIENRFAASNKDAPEWRRVAPLKEKSQPILTVEIKGKAIRPQ